MNTDFDELQFPAATCMPLVMGIHITAGSHSLYSAHDGDAQCQVYTFTVYTRNTRPQASQYTLVINCIVPHIRFFICSKLLGKWTTFMHYI